MFEYFRKPLYILYLILQFDYFAQAINEFVPIVKILISSNLRNLRKGVISQKIQ